MSATHQARAVQVAIIGAGAGGIAAAVHLDRVGIHDYVILERDDGPGGVWRANTYPGARCDIPSHFYSFSFALNKNWTETYAAQPEILAYFERVARSRGVMSRLQTKADVVSLTWHTADRHWMVQLRNGDHIRAEHVVAATGVFSSPSFPSGIDAGEFAGEVLHSAQWHPGIDLTGQRVAVIGSGASAIQIVPAAAEVAEHVQIFQREPAWILPKDERAFTPIERALFARLPGLARVYRLKIWLGKEVWTTVVPGSRLHRRRARMAIRHLEANVTETSLRERLRPEYAYGCKRLLRSADYYRAVQTPSVELVADEVAGLNRAGLETAAGHRYAADVVILCTGFKATSYLDGITVSTDDGRELRSDAWQNGPRAYLGVNVPGWPNLHLVYGPNTNVQSSALYMIEAQTRYISRRIKRSVSTGHPCEVKAHVAARFDERLQRRMPRTVWLTGCGSYFQDAWGRVSTQWPYRPARYWLALRFARDSAYQPVASRPGGQPY